MHAGGQPAAHNPEEQHGAEKAASPHAAPKPSQHHVQTDWFRRQNVLCKSCTTGEADAHSREAARAACSGKEAEAALSIKQGSIQTPPARHPPMLAAIVAVTARGYSGGAPYCNADAHKIPNPAPATPNGGDISFECNSGECTLTASSSFKGFLVGVADDAGDTSFSSVPSQGQLMHDGRCFTHRNSQDWSGTSITFGVVQKAHPRVIRATVVFEKPIAHVYQTADLVLPAGSIAPTVPPTTNPQTGTTAEPTNPPVNAPRVIVGGGPGGLGAARYFESIRLPYTLYERGDYPPESFWTDPIDNTTNDFPKYYPITGGRGLGKGIGGTQNINGAVYAPGTPEDLAKSLGIYVSKARDAQNTAAGFVQKRNAAKTPDWADVAMMWAPINAGDHDDATLTNLNSKMARRSLAFEFTPTVGTVVVNTTVTSVDDTHYVVDGQRLPHSGIILAAGALQSPQLLGHERFELLNHGFRFELVDIPALLSGGAANPPDIYTFDYPEADNTTLGNTEIMDAAGNYQLLSQGEVPFNVVGRARVNMTMETPYKLWADKNKGICATNTFGGPDECEMNKIYGVNDPWHYMGSVRHRNMRVDGYRNVYIGDASALQVPFNCHTSMPAAAAGVLAAQALFGLTLGDTVYDVPPLPYKTRAFLFLAGLWVLAVGIAAHVLGRVFELPALRSTVHYVCQPVGTVLITVAAAWSALERSRNNNSGAASEAHRIVGWTTIGLLWLNALGGISLKIINYNKLSGLGHRYSGYAITFFLGAQAFTATVAGTGIDKEVNAIVFASTAGALLVLAMANNGGDFKKPEKGSYTSLEST